MKRNIVAWMVILMLMCSLLSSGYWLVSDIKAYYSIPRETDDYSMIAGYGAGNPNASAEVVIVKTLKEFSAFGKHPLISLSPTKGQFISVFDFGKIHKAYVAWQSGKVMQYTEIDPELISVVIDGRASLPTIQWKWQINYLHSRWKQEDLGGLAPSASAKIRMTLAQYKLEPH